MPATPPDCRSKSLLCRLLRRRGAAVAAIGTRSHVWRDEFKHFITARTLGTRTALPKRGTSEMELLTRVPLLDPRSGNVLPPDETSSTRLSLSSAIAPFRSDLKGAYAVARAGQILRSEPATPPEEMQAARDKVRSALKIGPHNARPWLILALLQARCSPVDPLVSQSLKMSHLTGPNQVLRERLSG
jgi:hypothetical protein